MSSQPTTTTSSAVQLNPSPSQKSNTTNTRIKNASSSLPKKKSQRPTWSCTECTRRKIKCDRVVPGCSACKKRNRVDQCRLETEAEMDERGVDRIDQLEQRNAAVAAAGGKPAGYEQQSRESSVATSSHLNGDHNGSLGSALTKPNTQIRKMEPGQFDAAPPRSSSPATSSIHPSIAPIPVSSNGTAPSPEIQSITHTVKEIKSHLQHLEQVLARLNQDHPNSSSELIPHPESDRTRLHEPTPAQPLQPVTGGVTLKTETPSVVIRRPGWDQINTSPPEADGELEAAETLEFLAMGRDRKEQHLSRSELRRAAEEEDDELDESNNIVVDSTPSTSSSFVHGWTHTPGVNNDASPAPSQPSQTVSTANPQYRPGSAGGSTHKSSPGKFDHSLNLLDERRSRSVIRWAMDRLLAHNGLIHPPTFTSECVEFETWSEHDRYRLVNAAWLALYYAVLCGGIQQMTRDDALAIGLSIDEYHRLPKLYFDQTVEALHRADFLGKHSIFSVQAICVLETAGYEAGKSDLINILIGCGIRIAQHLQLHRLGSDQEWETRQRRKGIDLRSEAGTKAVITREICKRLWCTLGTDDWFTCSYRHTYAIHPAHTTTPLPLNLLDADLSNGALSNVRAYDEPTPASKLLVLHALADELRSLFDELVRVGVEVPNKQLTDRIEQGIDQVMKKAPKWLQPDWAAGNEVTTAVPDWVGEMRQHWFISCEHKKLVMHRLCPSSTRHPYARQSAVSAARRILRQFTIEEDSGRRLHWTIAYHTIVACTTLLLDIFHDLETSPSTSASTLSDYQIKRQEITRAVEGLRLVQEDSIISSRGVRLIESMLFEEQKLFAEKASSSKKRSRGEEDLEGLMMDRPGSSNGISGPGQGFGLVAKKIVTSSSSAAAARKKSISSSPLSTSGSQNGISSTMNALVGSNGVPLSQQQLASLQTTMYDPRMPQIQQQHQQQHPSLGHHPYHPAIATGSPTSIPYASNASDRTGIRTPTGGPLQSPSSLHQSQRFQPQAHHPFNPFDIGGLGFGSPNSTGMMPGGGGGAEGILGSNYDPSITPNAMLGTSSSSSEGGPSSATSHFALLESMLLDGFGREWFDGMNGGSMQGFGNALAATNHPAMGIMPNHGPTAQQQLAQQQQHHHHQQQHQPHQPSQTGGNDWAM